MMMIIGHDHHHHLYLHPHRYHHVHPSYHHCEHPVEVGSVMEVVLADAGAAINCLILIHPLREAVNIKKHKTQPHSAAFGGVFPNISEAILVDEISIKVRIYPPKVIT